MGPAARRRLVEVESLEQFEQRLDELDPTVELPVGSIGLPRGHQGLCVGFEDIEGALDYPGGIETTRRARYLDNFEAYVQALTEHDEDRPFALLAD